MPKNPLIVIVLLLAVAALMWLAFEQGWQRGHEAGKRAGFEDGRTEGFEDGYAQAHADCKRSPHIEEMPADTGTVNVVGDKGIHVGALHAQHSVDTERLRDAIADLLDNRGGLIELHDDRFDPRNAAHWVRETNDAVDADTAALEIYQAACDEAAPAKLKLTLVIDASGKHPTRSIDLGNAADCEAVRGEIDRYVQGQPTTGWALASVDYILATHYQKRLSSVRVAFKSDNAVLDDGCNSCCVKSSTCVEEAVQ